MSWDILIMSSDGTPEDLNTVPSGWLPNPIGEVSVVREQINRAIDNVDWSVPAWGNYKHGGLSIEINLQEEGEVESFALHIRGQGDPIPVIATLCKQNGWVAIDYYDSRMIDFKGDALSRWKRFTDYRDDVLNELDKGTT